MEEGNPERDDFSRGDLDRVIRRAVELQFDEGTESGSGARLNESEVLRIGSEVGIGGRFLRQAIGEVRAERLLPDAPYDAGFLARWIGERTARAHRVVPGSVEEIGSSLDEHLRVAETLVRVRSRHGRSLWEPAEGLRARLHRGLRWKGHGYELARVSGLEVALHPIKDGFVLVSLAADLRKDRAGNAAGGGVGGGVNGAAAGVGIGFLIGFPLLGIPTAALGALGGLRIARASFRKRVERVVLALEGLLDRLESGEALARRPVSSGWPRLPWDV